MTKKPRLSVNSFVFFVVFGAIAATGYDTWASEGQKLFGPRPDVLVIFAACCLVTELRPLRWLRRRWLIRFVTNGQME